MHLLKVISNTVVAMKNADPVLGTVAHRFLHVDPMQRQEKLVCRGPWCFLKSFCLAPHLVLASTHALRFSVIAMLLSPMSLASSSRKTGFVLSCSCQ